MIAYLLVSLFVMGMFAGSSVESKKFPTVAEWLLLSLIALAWPWMLYASLKEKVEARP